MLQIYKNSLLSFREILTKFHRLKLELWTHFPDCTSPFKISENLSQSKTCKLPPLGVKWHVASVHGSVYIALKALVPTMRWVLLRNRINATVANKNLRPTPFSSKWGRIEEPRELITIIKRNWQSFLWLFFSWELLLSSANKRAKGLFGCELFFMAIKLGERKVSNGFGIITAWMSVVIILLNCFTWNYWGKLFYLPFRGGTARVAKHEKSSRQP